MKKRKKHSIQIDIEAYRILKSRKRRGDTWSDVIKVNVRPALVGPALVGELKRIYPKDLSLP